MIFRSVVLKLLFKFVSSSICILWKYDRRKSFSVIGNCSTSFNFLIRHVMQKHIVLCRPLAGVMSISLGAIVTTDLAFELCDPSVFLLMSKEMI